MSYEATAYGRQDGGACKLLLWTEEFICLENGGSIIARAVAESATWAARLC